MAGTRTAPTVDGTGFNLIKVSLAWIDWTADKRSDSYSFDVTATPAEIEAYCAAAQAISNASLYKITVGEVYAANADSGDGLEEVWENVDTNLVLQAVTPAGASIRGYVPSPVESMFIDNTDDIDPTDAALITYIAAFVALLPAGYGIKGARLTHRRQINQQVPI